MRATIVIPKTAAKYEHALDTVKQHFADKYGGYTAYDATGGWSHNGNLIEEPNTVVEVYGDIQSEGGIVQVAERVREITGEEAVAYTVGGSMGLV